MSSDISWYDMIHDIPEDVLSFRLNAISKALPSPSNLHRWGVKKEGKCHLCNKQKATAAHILSNCYVALTQDRYTWRHDNVLIAIHKDLIGLVRSIATPTVAPLGRLQSGLSKKGILIPVAPKALALFLALTVPLTGRLTSTSLANLRSLVKPMLTLAPAPILSSSL